MFFFLPSSELQAVGATGNLEHLAAEEQRLAMELQLLEQEPVSVCLSRGGWGAPLYGPCRHVRQLRLLGYSLHKTPIS